MIKANGTKVEEINMRKFFGRWLVVIGALLTALGAATYTRNHQHRQAAQFVNSPTPTIFFHGWGSSYRAEQQMANYARNRGVTTTIIRADVATNGQVTWYGRLTPGARNPIIEVNLQNNKSVAPGNGSIIAAYAKSSDYVLAVMRAVKAKYGFKQVNVVAHSMGNLQVYYYLRAHGQDRTLPQIQKLVDLAGHWNGLVMEPGATDVTLAANGQPSLMLPQYQGLLRLRQTFPTQIAVLNIYGNSKNHTDGTVPNVSSQSLRWLIQARARSYQEKIITGPGGQHSRLHENKTVDRLLVQFLWQTAPTTRK